MEDLLNLLGSLDESEIKNMISFLKEYKKSRSSVEKKIEAARKVLELQNVAEVDMEHTRISKLRGYGLITVDEELRRITELYKNKTS